MHPAVASRPRLLRRRTVALLAASAAVVGAAALLHARAPRGTVVATPARPCGPGDPVDVGNGLRLAVRAQACQLLRGTTETHVAIEVDATAAAAARRAPVALSLVVDRSGSMIGAPLEDAKAAALRALDALGPDDAFSLVTYSSEAELAVPLARATDAHKAEARAAIERIRADGGTNISAALSRGAAALHDGHGGDVVDRIVLISDGDPNEGIYDRDGLARLAARTAQDGTSITTIGVGLEFNERIMTDMAVAGRGNYYFVEHTADLPSIFGRELGSLAQTVAVDTRVELTPAPGVEIAEAYGYRTDAVGGAVIVPVADLHAGEARKVVVRLRVDATVTGARPLVTARLRWRPVDAHQERVADATVAVTVTDDAAAATASTIAIAEGQVQEARMARALDAATEAYERGDLDAARQIVSQQADEAERAAASTGDAALGAKMRAVGTKAAGAFSAPASAAPATAKKARNMAYDLSR